VVPSPDIVIDTSVRSIERATVSFASALSQLRTQGWEETGILRFASPGQTLAVSAGPLSLNAGSRGSQKFPLTVQGFALNEIFTVQALSVLDPLTNKYAFSSALPATIKWITDGVSTCPFASYLTFSPTLNQNLTVFSNKTVWQVTGVLDLRADESRTVFKNIDFQFSPDANGKAGFLVRNTDVEFVNCSFIVLSGAVFSITSYNALVKATGLWVDATLGTVDNLPLSEISHAIFTGNLGKTFTFNAQTLSLSNIVWLNAGHTRFTGGAQTVLTANVWTGAEAGLAAELGSNITLNGRVAFENGAANAVAYTGALSSVFAPATEPFVLSLDTAKTASWTMPKIVSCIENSSLTFNSIVSFLSCARGWIEVLDGSSVDLDAGIGHNNNSLALVAFAVPEWITCQRNAFLYFGKNFSLNSATQAACTSRVISVVDGGSVVFKGGNISGTGHAVPFVLADTNSTVTCLESVGAFNASSMMLSQGSTWVCNAPTTTLTSGLSADTGSSVTLNSAVLTGISVTNKSFLLVKGVLTPFTDINVAGQSELLFDTANPLSVLVGTGCSLRISTGSRATLNSVQLTNGGVSITEGSKVIIVGTGDFVCLNAPQSALFISHGGALSLSNTGIVKFDGSGIDGSSAVVVQKGSKLHIGSNLLGFSVSNLSAKAGIACMVSEDSLMLCEVVAEFSNLAQSALAVVKNSAVNFLAAVTSFNTSTSPIFTAPENDWVAATMGCTDGSQLQFQSTLSLDQSLNAPAHLFASSDASIQCMGSVNVTKALKGRGVWASKRAKIMFRAGGLVSLNALAGIECVKNATVSCSSPSLMTVSSNGTLALEKSHSGIYVSENGLVTLENVAGTGNKNYGLALSLFSKANTRASTVTGTLGDMLIGRLPTVKTWAGMTTFSGMAIDIDTYTDLDYTPRTVLTAAANAGDLLLNYANASMNPVPGQVWTTDGQFLTIDIVLSPTQVQLLQPLSFALPVGTLITGAIDSEECAVVNAGLLFGPTDTSAAEIIRVAPKRKIIYK
jgi:hypothetical protein